MSFSNFKELNETIIFIVDTKSFKVGLHIPTNVQESSVCMQALTKVPSRCFIVIETWN